MRFEHSVQKNLKTIEFRTKEYIYETNTQGFYVTQGQTRIMIFSIELHQDHHGGTIQLCESLDINQEIRLYYGDRDWIISEFDHNIFEDPTFKDKYTYNGQLGALWGVNSTTFALWSPLAISSYVLLYKNHSDNVPYDKIPMKQKDKGTYQANVQGNLHGVYYLYEITFRDKIYTTTDPYAKACGANCSKSMVVNLDLTDPDGFNKNYHILPENQTDTIIYEMNVRDFSISQNSGISEQNKGKFLAFTETPTTSTESQSTCIDHLKQLGITHIHLLPVMDFSTVDETEFNTNSYNWGYDPVSYFCLDGSYSSNPYDGDVRIKEFKQLVHSLHENGIGVILDVVYNHTYHTVDSNLNLTMPDYYYRKIHGHFSNGSGCGNELDTQKLMVRNLIINSIKYWVTEFAIDGFRFDLMGLMDLETSNIIRKTLDEFDPRIIMYGEGWTGGGSTLPGDVQTNKYNSHRLNERIGLFNDEFRDAIKGDTFRLELPGYTINARDKDIESSFIGRIMAGIVAQTPHPSIHYNGQMSPFAISPTQTVNYHSAHDNYTLHDKLVSSADWANGDALKEIYKICAGLVLTSQGIPFLMGGEEFMRSKVAHDGTFDHNSYKSPDSVNQVDWSLKSKNQDIFNYYKGLIDFRKAHPALRINNNELLMSSLRFFYTQPNNRVGYIIDAEQCGDSLREIVVIINPTTTDFECDLTHVGNQMCLDYFSVYVDKYNSSKDPLYSLDSNIAKIQPVSITVLGR